MRTSAAGQLAAVNRYGPEQGLEVRRELIYAGLNGRLSEERTIFGTAGPVEGYATRLEYNPFGLLSKLFYPEARPVAGFAREVTFTYKNGFLTQAGEGAFHMYYVQDVTYNAAGGKGRLPDAAMRKRMQEFWATLS